MLASFQIRYQGPVPGSLNLTQRQFNDLVREAWLETGEYWWNHFLPKHFTHEGAREYGYLPRSGEAGTPGARHFWTSYSGRKQREEGHTLPLVFAGRMRGEATTMRSVRAEVTSGKSTCHVVFNVPEYVDYKSPHG